jgi:hypothetical protein
MQPPQRPDESVQSIPADVRARVMPAVFDELARWGVERFSVEAMAERHTSMLRWCTATGAIGSA